jgi:transglutaminase-like putative cysteine protease
MAMLLALLLPKNIAPAPWYGLHNLVAEHFSFLQNLRPTDKPLVRGDGGEFYLYEFGRQSEKELGGPLYLDNTILLEVNGGGSYLRGTVLDHYNGHGWSDTTLFFKLGNLSLPPEKLMPDLSESELTIKHLRLRTSTLFTGLYPQSVIAPPGTLLINGSGSLKLDKSVPLNYEYHVVSYNLLYRPLVDGQISADIRFGLNRYLELPVDLPERITKLALEITAGQQTSYGKIKALESHLRRYYSYTTASPQTPEDRDFVDYFLFDLQEGYCTYFATALAVMGRTVGVPTRYVSGFTIPAEPAANGRYYIAGTDAHAWVEAYLPGLGWLPFEATPGYVTDASLASRTRSDYLPYFSGVEPERVSESGRTSLRDYDPDRDRTVVDSGNRLKVLAIFNRLLIVALIIILLLTGGLVALVLFRLRKVKQRLIYLDNLSTRGQAVGYYNLTLIFLERLNLGKYPGETPYEYSLRIIRDVHLWDLNFREISAGVALALYSRQQLPKDLVWKTRQFYHVIFNRYLQKAGRLTAFIEIFIYGRYLTDKL